MQIQTSTVNLAASRVQETSYSLEIETQGGFRAVSAGVEARDKAARVAEERERVGRLLGQLVTAILAAIEGKTCRPASGDPACSLADGRPSPDGKNGLTETAETAKTAGQQFDWSCRVTERWQESEQTCVQGRGQVTTTDGRCLDFSFSTAFSHQEVRASSLLESGSIVLKDPLMLGFDGKAVELNGRRIDFDLDADGQPESIPTAGAGCGFLVFDRNGNGRADDGSELFGTKSGNGFADLAAFDSDGNGWVDAGDADFAKLGVWDEAGFQTLAQRGVGALYTAAVDAPFTLKTRDAAPTVLGQIRAAGVYLMESGQVGRLHQVDLATQPASVAAAEQEPDQRQGLAERETGKRDTVGRPS